MDITSHRLLILKGLLFAGLGLLSGGLLLAEYCSLRHVVLLAITLWAFSRFYYFCFYVLHHYVDPSFRYAGLMSLVEYMWKHRRRGSGTAAEHPMQDASSSSISRKA